MSVMFSSSSHALITVVRMLPNELSVMTNFRHRFIVGRFVMMSKIIQAECHPDGFAFHSELLCCLARFVLPIRNVFDALETLVSEVHQYDVLWHRPCSLLNPTTVGTLH